MSPDTAERFFESICAHTGVGVIATDEQFHIRFWNAAAGRLFGGSSESMVGQPILSVVPDEYRRVAQRLLERALERGEVRDLEFRHEDPAGRSAYLAATISPVPAAGGGNAGVSICVRDVTRGMEMVREVAEAQRTSALGVMAGAVAHHFNNLLGGIITTIDFAKDSSNPDVLRRALNATASALARAHDLTRKLLAFAEGDRTRGPRCEVAEIIRQFVAQHQEHWAQRDIRVETDLPDVAARLPARHLNTVLEILVDNACEAMLDGGTLRFELASTEDRHILVRVGDTGVGIPQEQGRRVFEPFFTTKRVQNPDKPEHLGLGLAVVHGVVRDLGGTVSIEPGASGGTVCTVRLPARQASR